MKKLENKVAIITGGTSGIGESCAKAFAENGASVIITGRNKNKGLEVEKKINNFGGCAKYIYCDVTVEEEVKKLIEKTVEYFNGIDILFNNAGVFLPSLELDRLEFDSWNQTFKVNTDGYFLVTKYVMPYLLKSKGVILNNASIAGMQSYARGCSYAYSASKAAVIQFSRMLAKNYARDGVRVNCICPGIIETPILHDCDLRMYAERIPMGRVGVPEDVSKVAVFLVSNDAAYLTGIVIPVDGGASI